MIDTTELLGLRSTPLLASFTGATLGGTASAVIFAYGEWAVGLTDLTNANRSALAGSAGAVAGAVFVITAEATVEAFGVATTGTAIAGLHGAALTSATLAWLGGGSVATGTLVLSGGTAIVFVVAVAGVTYAFHYMDVQAEKERLRMQIENMLHWSDYTEYHRALDLPTRK